MAQLVTSLVITRIDYCYWILAGLPAFRLVPLQRVRNAAARLVLNLGWRGHISPALQQLHWLLVMHRVTFKIATLMHQILHKRCSSYLADLVTFNTTYCDDFRYSEARSLRFGDFLLRSCSHSRTRYASVVFVPVCLVAPVVVTCVWYTVFTVSFSVFLCVY